MCVLCDCIPCMYRCPRKPEEGDKRATVVGLQAVVRHLTWGARNQTQASGRAVSAHNH